MQTSESTVSGHFVRALEHYRRGALREADLTLTRLLDSNPRHFDGLHLQGLIASRLGQPQRAVDLLRRAVGIDPGVAAAYRHLGNALRDLGLGSEALSAYGRAIECRRDFKEAYVNRATTLLTLGRPAPALADLDRALALGAADAHVHLLRASALIDLGRATDALASADLALARPPPLPEAHLSRAIACYLTGAYRESLESCDAALMLEPRLARGHAQRGAALHALGCLDAALQSVDRALALDGRNAFAHSIRALCLLDMQRPQSALESCDLAIALRPDHADAHNTRGLALADVLRFNDSIASFDRAIALGPTAREPHFNKGIRLLQLGHFVPGWELHERRPVVDRAAASGISAPRLSGLEGIAGSRVLLYAEQGLGDTLQFCRYAMPLQARGARVVLAVQDVLCRLLRSLGTGVDVVGLSEIRGDFDWQCPLLSLPGVFGTTLDTIPSGVPYLKADPGAVAAWRQRLGDQGRLIGIRWQGSTGRADAGRSFSLQHFEPLARIPGVRLISLQKGPGSEQLHELSAHWVRDLGDDFEPGAPDAFIDVAAVMQCLDLVITSDTSIAHLAGALGRPTWVALKQVPDWRWLLDRDDSPWYPTMRLFRQRRAGDWAGVFERMRHEIEKLEAVEK
jgi:tetratricopeptide (TPR) repeat protein